MPHFTACAGQPTLEVMGKDQKPPLKERLQTLVRWAGYTDVLNEDGAINHNALSRDIERRTGSKIEQSTITRILQGRVRDGRPATIDVLARYFAVDPAVIRGESGLPQSRPQDDDPDMASYLDDIERARKQLGRLKQPALGQVIQIIDSFVALQDERYAQWADSQKATLEKLYDQRPGSRAKK